MNNFNRLIRLAEETFATRQDPSQLDVNEQVLEQLGQLHPATVSEQIEGDGPVSWVLLIPTQTELMNLFLSGDITEKELFQRTQPGVQFDCLYLCSGLVLEEYRRQGIAKKLALQAIREIQKDHPIRCLFVWAHTPEGLAASRALAREVNLPLLTKEK